MKLTLSKALAATCWLAALIAVAAAATQHQTAMGIAGLVGVVAASAWGLVRWLEDDADEEWWYWADYEIRAYREQVWARREGELDEDELPYRPTISVDELFAEIDQDRQRRWHQEHRQGIETVISKWDGSVTRYRGLGPAWDSIDELEPPYAPVVTDKP